MPIKPVLLPPFEEITGNNNGPIVSIIAFVLVSITFLVVLIKTVSMVYLKRVVLSIDGPIWIGTIIAIAQTLLIQFAVNHGMGRHYNALSSSTFEAYSQLTYIAQLLLFLVLSLSKVSTTNLIQSINPKQSIKRYCRSTQIAIGGWTVLALFGYAFQCQPPHWRYLPSRCVGEGAITYPVMIINMLVDVALVVLPTLMLWNVQMSLARRLKLIATFASRTLVVVVDAIQLSYLGQYLHSTDPTCWVMMNACIITTCIPALYRVINSLALGMNNVQISEQLELSSSKTPRRARSGIRRVAHADSSDQAEKGAVKLLCYETEIGLPYGEPSIA
ncbi:hypothetical protein BDV28DRAFT_165511 [Aspergillus coremiiformis]|uniref:Rhodopsin domain-containing protein n=1 Tax=Aspergillus coremiiformis TaxID=138285 RepID=A0A5N6Z430_9EURO|nr:hypothetical protein BDV28DRAFT_165511 [Aspergillus coremiiformis]